MDETLKSEMLNAVAAEHEVDVTNPSVAEEWQSWSVDNQHLAGSALGDAVNSFVSHLTKRGIISTTTASTEAGVPAASGAHYTYDHDDHDDDDHDDDQVDGEAGREEHPAEYAGGAYEDELEDLAHSEAGKRTTFDELMRRGDAATDAEVLLGGGDDDPDYEPHEYVSAGRRYAGSLDADALEAKGGYSDDDDDDDEEGGEEEAYGASFVRGGRLVGSGLDGDSDGEWSEDDVDEGALAAGAAYDSDEEEAALLMAGARGGFIKSGIHSTRMSMIVGYARHLASNDPRRLQTAHNEGMFVGEALGRAVARYLRSRASEDTPYQQSHQRAIAITLLMHMIGASGTASTAARERAAMRLDFLKEQAAAYFSAMFPDGAMREAYEGRRTVALTEGELEMIGARSIRKTFSRAKKGLGKAGRATGGAVVRGAAATSSAAKRTAARARTVARAAMSNRQRQSLLELVLDVVQHSKISRTAVPGFGAAAATAGNVEELAKQFGAKVAAANERRPGTASAAIDLLSGVVHAYFSYDLFQPHAAELTTTVTRVADSVFSTYAYAAAGTAGVPEGRGSTPALPSRGKYYSHDEGGAGYHGTTATATAELGRFTTLLTKSAEAYLRDNPSCVKKAGSEFALLVPADARNLDAIKQKLLGSDAEEQKRYLQNALLARHPNEELDALGHMLSLSGRPFRVERAPGPQGATMRVQRMRRPGRPSKHEDVWDAELRNVGGALAPHENHKAMHCRTPAAPGADVHSFRASAHAGSQVVEIRPLHFHVASQ